jgi:hypothetical protein
MPTRSPRTKRTYNLSEVTLHRVRELAADESLGGSQDAVVETAIERLYDNQRARAEELAWERAHDDPAFRAEAAAIARDFDDADRWPR